VGRAGRARDQRELDQQRQQRMVWIATSGVLLAVVAVAAVLVVRNRTPAAPGPATPSAADRAAPASLKLAANKIGFHPEPIPGVGKIEDKPASDAAPNANPDLLKPGTTAPAFSLKTPLGDTVSLSDFAGKALLLEFFATSCPHCQAEAPHLEALYNSLDRSRYAMASTPTARARPVCSPSIATSGSATRRCWTFVIRPAPGTHRSRPARSPSPTRSTATRPGM
jgi:hypothetical protein